MKKLFTFIAIVSAVMLSACNDDDYSYIDLANRTYMAEESHHQYLIEFGRNYNVVYEDLTIRSGRITYSETYYYRYELDYPDLYLIDDATGFVYTYRFHGTHRIVGKSDNDRLTYDEIY